MRPQGRMVEGSRPLKGEMVEAIKLHSRDRREDNGPSIVMQGLTRHPVLPAQPIPQPQRQ